MERKKITTKEKKQIIDITDSVNQWLKEAGADEGLCQLFITHTTAALTTADLDPGTDKDMLDAFEAMVPKLNYRHPHDPSHVGDHIMASVIGPSVAIPFEEAVPLVGTWQRIVLVELNGPRERTIHFSILK